MTATRPAAPAPIPSALLNEAQRLAQHQRTEEAVALLARSSHPECDFRRGSLLTVLERWSEAEAAFRRANAAVPGHPELMIGLAQTLVQLNRAAEAVPLLAAVAAAQPNSGRVRYLHGVALDEAGLTDKAAVELKAAREIVVRPAENRRLLPWEVYVQISRRCNLRCAMCGHEVWKSNSGFMEQEVFDRVIAECKRTGVETMHILAGQGEPFLHPQVFEMLEQAVAAGLKVGIVTNGTPFNQARIDQLANIGLAYVQFSFAGWDKESYEGVYVGSKFERTLENLKGMNAAFPPGGRTAFAVKAVASGDWKATMKKTQDFLAGHGIDRIFTFVANNFGGTVQCGSFHEKHGVWSNKDLDHQRRMPCRVLLKAVGVFCDGTVTACGCYDSNAELRIGNIMEQGLDEIRQGEAFGRILAAFKDGDISKVPMCGKCDDPFG
ncbi:MAG: radical SAM protein [Solirubrobacterales bacterium]